MKLHILLKLLALHAEKMKEELILILTHSGKKSTAGTNLMHNKEKENAKRKLKVAIHQSAIIIAMSLLQSFNGDVHGGQE